ncbi:MAG: ABC transporter ATP-binding protein, partial [Acidimicrobiia bacterium]
MTVTKPPSLNGRESTDPYEPVGVEALFHRPKGHIDPDSSKGWIKRMMPVILAHKWVILTGLACALVMVFIQTAIPRIVKEAIDTSLPSPTHPERVLRPLAPYAYLLMGLAVGQFAFAYVFRYNLLKTAQLMEYDLRSNMFDHFNRLSFSFFDSVQTGQLISRANSDIRAVERFLTFAPMMAITGVQFLAALVLMMKMHTTLALVSLAPLPFVYLTGRYMRTRMFPISWIVQARMADVATIVEENVTGVRIVKSFAAEKQQIGVAADAIGRLRWAAIKQIDLRAKFAPLMENLPRVGLLLILAYGGWLALKQPPEVEVGTLVAFSAYVVMLQAPFRILGFLMIMSQRAAASAQRIFEIFDQQPQITDSPKAVDLTNPRGEVEFKNVTFAYGSGANILKDFNLHLRPGETVAMVGRTGCGKSTVARLIPRFYDVKDGQVLIDGKDVRDYT